MTRSAPFLLAVAAVCSFGIFASTAFAAAPCTSYAGLADGDEDGFCVFVGTATAATSGWSGKIDCDDVHKPINPGATEVVGDGIDQDCSGLDATFPFADPVVARYKATYGATWKPLVFIAEYDRCKAAAECDVDDVDGTMKINDAAAETHVFRDVFVGTSKVLGADGIREVVTLEDASHFKGGASSSGGSGIGTRAATKIADERAAEAVKPLREEMLAADIAIDGRVDAIEADNGLRDGVLNDHADVLREHEGLLAAHDDAFREEKRQREVADAVNAASAEAAQRRADAALREATDARDDARAAQSHGPLFEVGGVGGAIMRQDLPFLDTNGRPTGEFAREAAIGGGGIELRVGADLAGVQGAVFGQVFLGSDGVGSGAGSGPDMGVLVGADLLAETSSVEVGGWLGYLHTEDHSLDIERGTDYLEITVREDGVIGGILLQGDLTGEGAGRVVPFLRLGVGVGNYHGRRQSMGAINVTNRVGPLALLQGGVRFGAGALRH